jgi:hypothetical protein
MRRSTVLTLPFQLVFPDDRNPWSPHVKYVEKKFNKNLVGDAGGTSSV